MKWIYTTLLMLVTFATMAQQTGSITGKITDTDTKAAIEYATVSLYLNGDTKPAAGTISDNKGNFIMDKLAAGSYHIIINFIGYQAYTADNITVNNGKVDVGSIALKSTSNQLQTVTVTAKKPVIENKIDKMVYNPANDLTAQGGLALDILKKVPQVSVDVDGNVQLQGISSVRFLINGKPSTLFGSSIADALAAIPASQIQSIEVITSPGAKYDAQGLGGIINIILKDDKISGINGNINLSAGTRLQNSSANLSYRKGKLGISAFFSGNAQLNMHTLNTNNRTSVDSAGITNQFIQNGYSDFSRHGLKSGISFDYALGKKDNLTASIGYNYFDNNNAGATAQQLIVPGTADVLSNRNSSGKYSAKTVEWSMEYKHKFNDNGHELSAVYTSGHGANQADANQAQYLPGELSPFSASISSNPGKDRESSLSVDYALPLSKNTLLETGGRAFWRDINSNTIFNSFDEATGAYYFDANQSYDLLYNRKIYAGYASLTFKLFNYFDVKAGGRFERTVTGISSQGVAIPSYNTWIPTAVISHKLSETSSIKLSYTKRLERSDYSELNPFVNISDPYNLVTGNPLLKPEIGNVFELGYNNSFDSGANIYVALFSRRNSNDVKSYTNFYTDYLVGDSVYHNVSVSTRQNIGTEQNTGMSISGTIPFGKKLNLRPNVILTNRYIMNKLYGGPDISAITLRMNINLAYQLSDSFAAELFGNYQSPSKNIQGQTPKFIAYNIALRKQFMNKRASIGLTATNPFSKYINQVTTVTRAATTNGQPYSSYNLRQIPYQSFGVSLSWRFGKMDFGKDKEQDNQVRPVDN